MFAVRCLCSKETLAPPTSAIHQALLKKHLSYPADRRQPPSSSVPPMSITAADIKGAIRSFKPGSAGGRDCLRPQHLRDMIDDRVGGDACGIRQPGPWRWGARVGPSGFFGASFNKIDGGIRPIAVGLTLRRLVAKAANTRALLSCASVLAPAQLGVGVKGGTEGRRG